MKQVDVAHHILQRSHNCRVKAQGVVNWSCSNMGDPNGSIPTLQLVSKQKGGKYGVASKYGVADVCNGGGGASALVAKLI
ncbi:hypothetical protein L1987_69781 [Smallanthus sonchifolius]|uniref:Uncharacterized protein n=1 Tax=Smallanthus sonchifolius TaxID=185202 RepID=A0ACB9B6M5_9ASTR|nr:hypothetical protein L1987_69781 [Smallanthus sonchifolius]